MKITIVTGPFYPTPPAPCGAVERLWADLAGEFAGAGHEVRILCRGWPGQPAREEIGGVRYERLTRMRRSGNLKLDLAKDMLYSLRILRRLPPADVTVTNAFWLPWLMTRGPTRSVARRAGRVVVNVARWPKGQMKLYLGVDRLAAVSGAVAGAVAAQCPAAAPLVKVLPNPIDTAAFAPEGRDYGSPPRTLLYTGRVHPEKGVHVLIDAFAEVYAESPGLRLVLMGATSVPAGGGGEDYLKALRAKAAALPVEFREPVYDRPALAAALRAADLYCYPSLAETGESFGVAPLEAMATGLAPVVSNLAVFRDFLTDGETGRTFDHRGDGAAGRLAAVLREVIADPASRASMGRAAAEVAARFGNAAVARQYLDDFATLTGPQDPAR